MSWRINDVSEAGGSGGCGETAGMGRGMAEGALEQVTDEPNKVSVA